MVQSAEGGEGKDKVERIIVVVRSPCQKNYPADAHPSAHKSVLESANPQWTQSVHLDAPGQRHGQQPVSGTADPGVVKQDKPSRGSVDTTKTRSDPQRVRMSSGERPIGATKGKHKQPNTEALCQPPPPLPGWRIPHLHVPQARPWYQKLQADLQQCKRPDSSEGAFTCLAEAGIARSKIRLWDGGVGQVQWNYNCTTSVRVVEAQMRWPSFALQQPSQGVAEGV